jgi:hypothetical protein
MGGAHPLEGDDQIAMGSRRAQKKLCRESLAVGKELVRTSAKKEELIVGMPVFDCLMRRRKGAWRNSAAKGLAS